MASGSRIAGQMNHGVKQFGPFEVDLARSELRKNGVRLRLHSQPFAILEMLVNSDGEMVSREQIVKRLWGDATFVDFEQGVGAAISKLRRALSDSASTPRYIETVRNQGFRLLLPVRDVPLPAPAQELPVAIPGRWRLAIIGALGAGALVLGWATVWNRWKETAPATRPVRSVAVLPFRVLQSAEPAPYAGLGMADALITSLSHLRQVPVRPTSAIRKYVAADSGALEAGRELKVDAVVEGTIQESNGMVHIGVQMVLIPEGNTAWADSFDEAAGGLLNLQDRVARRVAASLAVEFTPAERQRIEKRYTSNAAASQAYQKGRYLWSQRTADALERSIPFFEQAIALDPNYALAYSGLADSYVLAYLYSPRNRREWVKRAKQALERALGLDPQLAQALATSAGITFQYDWDFAGAEKSFLHAIELNPNYATAHQWYAEMLFYLGRFDQSAVEIRRAHDLDPQSVLINLQLASPLLYSRKWREAIAVASESRKLDPGFALTSYVIGTAHTELGEFERAYAEFGKISGTTLGLTGLGYAYGRAGDTARAQAMLSKLLDLARRDEVSPYQVAAVYANLGRKAEAFDWLERAKAERDERIVVMRVDPKLDPLRKEPRFQALLRSVGL